MEQGPVGAAQTAAPSRLRASADRARAPEFGVLLQTAPPHLPGRVRAGSQSGAGAQPTAMRRGFASAVLGKVSVSTPSSSWAPMRSRSTLPDCENDRAQCPTLYSV